MKDIAKIFKMFKAFKNLFKILMKIFKNLSSLKIKGLQRSSWRSRGQISKKLKPYSLVIWSETENIFLNKYIKVLYVIESKYPQVKGNKNYITFNGCHWIFFLHSSNRQCSMCSMGLTYWDFMGATELNNLLKIWSALFDSLNWMHIKKLLLCH